MRSLEELTSRAVVLRVVDIVEDREPLSDATRGVVQLDAVDVGSRSARHGLARRILPHSAHVVVRVVFVGRGIDRGKHSRIQVELSGYLGRPLGDEVVLRDIFLRKHGLELLVAVILVGVHQALSAIGIAQVHQVGHHLGHLEGVGVVRQRERGVGPEYLVGYGAVEPLGREQLVPHGILVLAGAAEEVEVDFNVDFSPALTDGPAGVGSKNGDRVAEGVGGGDECKREFVHLIIIMQKNRPVSYH